MRPPLNAPVDPTCKDMRDCFAKRARRGTYVCTILNKGYSSDGGCPFCKPLRNEKPENLPLIMVTDSLGKK